MDPEYGEYFEGDMVLDAEQMEAILSSSRNGLLNTTYRWPDKTVVYEMTTNHTKEQQLYIKMAHWVIESVSCIKFVQRTNESHYIQYRVRSFFCHIFENLRFLGVLKCFYRFFVDF